MRAASVTWTIRILVTMTALIVGFAANAAAELRNTTSAEALCSNGEQATYAYYNKGESKLARLYPWWWRRHKCRPIPRPSSWNEKPDEK